jgi:hypothetical protein
LLTIWFQGQFNFGRQSAAPTFSGGGGKPPQDPDPLQNQDALPVEFRNESGRDTDKAEGFADDTTGMSLFELESLACLKKILSDFGKISGLQCNVEKTVLMQVGSLTEPSEEILNLGFSHVNEIRILGMTIDQNISQLDQNFTVIHEKIKISVAYWKRYNLSLPGRINVIKSLLVSLINHLGCFLMPKPVTLKGIQKTLDDFALGKIRVARVSGIWWPWFIQFKRIPDCTAMYMGTAGR